jgi:glycolate oxidase iron-sulfur subunit
MHPLNDPSTTAWQSLMQTHFSPQQLSDPRTAESERILRKCVHCGFCTATCPTYVLLGDELDSPRGRIYLIKGMLEEGGPATPEVVRHVDRCLSCLACVTTCPSGVDYRHLVENARRHIETTYERPRGDRLLRTLIARVLPYPRRFRAALVAARLARPFAALLPARLRAMLALAPPGLPPQERFLGRVFPARGPRRMRVALLEGCAQSVLQPQVHAATIRLLTRAGAEVVVVGGCCGALTHHMGREEPGTSLARAQVTQLVAERDAHGLDAVVTNASGCGLHVADYGHVFAGDTALAGPAAAISALARDVTQVIAALGLPPVTQATGEVVAYHSACSMQHGQKLDGLPRELLRAAGYDVRDIAENHLCCGSAGSYNLLQPEIAARLRERKLAHLRATGAAIVATGNVGCAMQLREPGGPAILHTIELLDRATSGAANAAERT